MPRWKTTENILVPQKDGEYFIEDWMNYDSLSQYLPPSPIWLENRPIKFEDVDLWEVIVEWTGLSGVYAAWAPYAHYFIVTDEWKIIDEFWGIQGELKLQQYLKSINIPFSLSKIWVDEENVQLYTKETSNKLIIP